MTFGLARATKRYIVLPTDLESPVLKISLASLVQWMPAASPQFVVSQDAKRAHSATTVLVQFQVRTESRDAFAKLMQSVKLNLPQVPGCLEASVFISEGQPLRYVLVEQWESAARHAAHVRALQDSGEWRAIEQHLDGAPTVEYLLEQ